MCADVSRLCVFSLSLSSYVLNLMKSLRSRGYAKETFCWRWFYYYLTEEGVGDLDAFALFFTFFGFLDIKKTRRRRASRHAGECEWPSTRSR